MKEKDFHETDEQLHPKVGLGGYIALALAILFFSGLLAKVAGAQWLSALDFSTLMGKFGTMAHPEKNNFMGEGGASAKAGFLFALSLIPAVMLSLGVLEIFTHYGAIRAAQRLLTPLLRPILGIPGRTALAMITDLQSTDAGAALTKSLADEGKITQKELIIMTGWQYSGAGLISNYLASAAALFSVMTVPIVLPLALCIVMKFVGGIFIRFVLNTVYKEDFKHEQSTND